MTGADSGPTCASVSLPAHGETARFGVEVLDLSAHDDMAEAVRELTEGRGSDALIDAVGTCATGQTRSSR